MIYSTMVENNSHSLKFHVSIAESLVVIETYRNALYIH